MAIVIFLYGSADKAQNRARLAKLVCQKFAHIKFIFPQATTTPVSLNYGQ